MSVRIIGIDDWLIFGRDDNGALVYVVCEYWPEWCDAPHAGDADYGTPAYWEDWRYIVSVAYAQRDALDWQPDEYGLTMSDADFSARSAQLLQLPAWID